MTVEVTHFSGVGPIEVVVGDVRVEPPVTSRRPRLRLIQGGKR